MARNKAEVLNSRSELRTKSTDEQSSHGWLGSEGRSTHAERRLVRRILAVLGNPPMRIVLWDECSIEAVARHPIVTLKIHDRGMLLRFLSNPAYEVAEGYTAGRISIDGDLLEILKIIYTRPRSAGVSGRLSGLLGWFYRPQGNSLSDSRDNIHHHYDIGNEFYQLWLDEQLVYTCAYFPNQEISLEAAQVAKFDHVCRKLWLKPGESVVEAGCGWGALALHMAREYGVKVTAYNISKEQLAYARDRARREGVTDKVTYVDGDYRVIDTPCDVFVSVGMLEHVGVKHYRELGQVIDRCLKPGGRGLIHNIGRDSPGHLHPWIERRIFPGAYPPTLREMMQIFEPNGFSVLDVENIRMHYAKTLEHWWHRFEANVDVISAMFDGAFVRAWRLYLVGSIASFATGHMQLFQVLFSRMGNNRIPWTRGYQYDVAQD